MKFLRSHFALSKGQQNGIFVLVILIVTFQLVIFGVYLWPRDSFQLAEDPEVAEWIRQMDSLNVGKPTTRDTIYPFNPNFITDAKAYQLGLGLAETDRLLDHRKKGNWINSTDDFQKVTGVSDSLLKRISPSFRFPEWVKKAEVPSAKKEEAAVIKKGDLNAASEVDLKKVQGVGEVLASRIVKYRYRIGGFRDAVQLRDVYGLSDEVVNRILQRFEIKTAPGEERKDLNSIGLAELSEMPYFNYELARRLIDYRNLHEGIRSFEELIKIEGFPSDKIDRIKLYLAIN